MTPIDPRLHNLEIRRAMQAYGGKDYLIDTQTMRWIELDEKGNRGKCVPLSEVMARNNMQPEPKGKITFPASEKPTL